MGTVYLDEDDLVRFDETADNRFARRAAVARGTLKLTEIAAALVLTCDQAKAICGSRKPHVARATLAELATIRQEIFAEGRQREVSRTR